MLFKKEKKVKENLVNTEAVELSKKEKKALKKQEKKKVRRGLL